jgi:hypothetical protein
MYKVIAASIICIISASSCHRKNIETTPVIVPDQKTLEMIENDLEELEEDTAIMLLPEENLSDAEQIEL